MSSYLGSSVVSVLTHFGDEDAGATAVVVSEGIHLRKRCMLSVWGQRER